MSRRLRVQVTVSYPLMVAMEVMAERNGLTIAAQAALSLRQALQRTMESAEVQRRVRAHNAQRTHAEYVEETITERAEELLYVKGTAGTGGAEEATPQDEAAGRSAVHAVADGGMA